MTGTKRTIPKKMTSIKLSELHSHSRDVVGLGTFFEIV